MNKFTRFLRVFETGVLVALFFIVLGVPLLAVVLRNTFSFGLVWSHQLVQMAVLWITMVGAMIAVRERGHIRLDVAERFLPESIKKYTNSIASFLTALVCVVFAIFSIEVIIWEINDGTFGIGILPSWIFVCIIPISGFVMGARFVVDAIKSLKR